MTESEKQADELIAAFKNRSKTKSEPSKPGSLGLLEEK